MRCHSFSDRLRPYQITPSHHPPEIHILATTPNKTAHVYHEEMPFQASHQRRGVNSGSGMVGELEITCLVVPHQPAQSPNVQQIWKVDALFHWTASTKMSLNFSTRAINHFTFLSVYHIFQLGTPYSTVLCQLHTLISETLSHCLLPPPDSEAPSMTLCAQFLFLGSEAMPHFMQEQIACFPLRISHRDTGDMTAPRKIAGEVRFRHHVGTCVLPCSCAVALPILSRVSALSSGSLGT